MHSPDRDVAASDFDATDIGTVKSSDLGQAFLRQAVLKPQRAKPLSEPNEQLFLFHLMSVGNCSLSVYLV